jgi:hypothetical protein
MTTVAIDNSTTWFSEDSVLFVKRRTVGGRGDVDRVVYTFPDFYGSKLSLEDVTMFRDLLNDVIADSDE